MPYRGSFDSEGEKLSIAVGESQYWSWKVEAVLVDFVEILLDFRVELCKAAVCRKLPIWRNGNSTIFRQCVRGGALATSHIEADRSISEFDDPPSDLKGIKTAVGDLERFAHQIVWDECRVHWQLQLACESEKEDYTQYLDHFSFNIINEKLNSIRGVFQNLQLGE